jgi:hypothetical protein
MKMRTTKQWKAFATLATLALALYGCGGSSDSEGSQASTVKRPSAEPPLYHQREYDAETSWDQERSDRHVGDYLESAWYDAAIPSSKMIIDSRPSEGAPPPMAAAELTRVQANWLPKYRERSFLKVKLGRQPAIRFAYDTAGESRIVYFFQHCGTSITFRGSTAPVAYEQFSEFYGQTASRVKVVCDE